ncbi:MAG TPA: hypothetical protein PKB14_09110 [Rubrivivax sp.]|nr:hypothetical protein [Rubrivivax sp.]
MTDASSGKAVADATVNYQARTQTYQTQTKANGDCSIDMPATEVAGVQYPAATVSKEGYEPQTVLCEAMRAGNTCYQDINLIPLALNVSIPVGGDRVMHLGDDLFDGAVNSQFQKATDGAELVLPISDWAAQVSRPGITKATVYLDAKGWQSDMCRNQIAIVGDAGTQSMSGGVSPSAGYWGGGRQVPFVFSVAQIGRLKGELKLIAGSCNDTEDIDDFEVNRIRVEFS